MFVPGKPFLSSLVFRDKHSSLLRNLLITAVISFVIQTPVAIVIKLFTAVIYEFSK
jgi:hypothetical protein